MTTATTSLKTVNLTAQIDELPKHQMFQYISGQTCLIFVESTETDIDNIQPVFSRCTLCNKEKSHSDSRGAERYHCALCTRLLVMSEESSGKEMFAFEAKIGSIVIDYLKKMRTDNDEMRILTCNVKVISKSKSENKES